MSSTMTSVLEPPPPTHTTAICVPSSIKGVSSRYVESCKCYKDCNKAWEEQKVNLQGTVLSRVV